METIIGLLFILLPVIMKLIGKKLERAGKVDQAGNVRELAKAFGSDDDEEPEVEYDDDGQITFVEPVAPQPAPTPVMAEPFVPAPAEEEVKRTVAPRKAMLIEEEVSKKGEKIDPKKLVIYSEIMKPKYNE